MARKADAMIHEKRLTLLDNEFHNRMRPRFADEFLPADLLMELDDAIAATVETFVKPPAVYREVSNLLALVTLGCFIVTAAVLLHLFISP
jgi:hypothetical protein